MQKEEKIPNVLDAIKTRRSVRKYLDLPVEFEKVGRVLDAGRMAPSAGNLQDWKFILVVEPENRLAVAEACLQQYWMAQAPVHIVVCAEPKKSERYYGKRGQEVYASLDGAMAAENMLLAAHGQGLGACFVAAMEEPLLRRALKIPEAAIPLGVITLGYSDEKPAMPMKFELHNIIFFEEFGEKAKDEAETYGEYAKHVSKALAMARSWAENVLKKMREVE
jgi:nitroreductase